MAINFNEDNIHVVKVGNSAQNEVREYFHELDTDLQGADVYYDFIWGPQLTDAEHQRMVRGFNVLFYDTEKEEMPVDHDYLDADEIRRHEEEMLKDIDHINYGLSCHELADCAQCANHAEYLEMKYWNSFGADDGAYDEAIRFHEEDVAWREHDRVSLSNDGYISLVAELGLDN